MIRIDSGAAVSGPNPRGLDLKADDLFSRFKRGAELLEHEFNKLVGEFIAANKLEAVCLAVWTPAFNDGDPCVPVAGLFNPESCYFDSANRSGEARDVDSVPWENSKQIYELAEKIMVPIYGSGWIRMYQVDGLEVSWTENVEYHGEDY